MGPHLIHSFNVVGLGNVEDSRLVVKPGPEASSNRGVTDDGRFWALLRLAREGSAMVTEDGEQWHNSICVIS